MVGKPPRFTPWRNNFSDSSLDYKKYIYACGVQRLNRLHNISRDLLAHADIDEGIINAEFDENQDNMRYIHENLGNLRRWLYVATFFDADAEPNRDIWPDECNLPRHDVLVDDDFLNYYSDGRIVSTTIRWDGGWVTHVWNPDPRHPDDRPGRVYRIEEYSAASPRRVIITAPGVVDVFDTDKRPGLFDDDDDTCEGNVG